MQKKLMGRSRLWHSTGPGAGALPGWTRIQGPTDKGCRWENAKDRFGGGWR
jgi:hypothetical protein